MAQGSVRACRIRTDGCRCISRVVGGAGWQHATLEIIHDAVRAGCGDGVTLFLLLLQSPLLNCSIDLAEVVDAGILLSRCTGLDEIGNRDGSQEADDRDDDHDFNKGEAGLTIGFDLHGIYLCLSACGRERHERLFY